MITKSSNSRWNISQLSPKNIKLLLNLMFSKAHSAKRILRMSKNGTNCLLSKHSKRWLLIVHHSTTTQTPSLSTWDLPQRFRATSRSLECTHWVILSSQSTHFHLCRILWSSMPCRLCNRRRITMLMLSSKVSRIGARSSMHQRLTTLSPWRTSLQRSILLHRITNQPFILERKVQRRDTSCTLKSSRCNLKAAKGTALLKATVQAPTILAHRRTQPTSRSSPTLHQLSIQLLSISRRAHTAAMASSPPPQHTHRHPNTPLLRLQLSNSQATRSHQGQLTLPNQVAIQLLSSRATAAMAHRHKNLPPVRLLLNRSPNSLTNQLQRKTHQVFLQSKTLMLLCQKGSTRGGRYTC